MRIKAIIAVLTVCLLFPILTLAEDVLIIGNPSIKPSSLSKNDVKYIFLGKKRSWDNGDHITFALHKKPEIQEAFLHKYLKKNPYQFKNYWKQQVLTGKDAAPRSFKSDQEVVKFIAETKGAIGYVSAGAKLDDVKMISVNH